MAAWSFYTSAGVLIATPSRGPGYGGSGGRARNVVASVTLGNQMRSESRGGDQHTLSLEWKYLPVADVRALDALFATYGGAAATFRVEVPDGALAGVVGGAAIPVRWMDARLNYRWSANSRYDVSMTLVEDVTSLVTSGTVTLANTRLSLASTLAWIDLTGVDLGALATGTRYLIVTDSAGRRLAGWLSVAGPGVNYGAELLTNGGFASATAPWTAVDCTLASVAGGESGNCLELTRTGGLFQQALQDVAGQVEGSLFLLTAYLKSGTAGAQLAYIGMYDDQVFPAYISATPTSTGSWVQATIQGVFQAGRHLAKVHLHKDGVAAGTMLFDTVSLKQIIAPSATGAWIVVSRNAVSSTVWALEDTGFNRNDAAGYRYAVYAY